MHKRKDFVSWDEIHLDGDSEDSQGGGPLGERDLSNEDWEQLRELILSEARDHDYESAFTPENINLHAGLQFILEIYQYGRERKLPPEWEQAWRAMRCRRGKRWKRYMEALDDIERLEQVLAPHMIVNLSTVVGRPISAVLEGELSEKIEDPKKRAKKTKKRPRK